MTTKQKPKTILRREEVNIVWNMQYSTKNYVKQQENVTHNQKKKKAINRNCVWVPPLPILDLANSFKRIQRAKEYHVERIKGKYDDNDSMNRNSY